MSGSVMFSSHKESWGNEDMGLSLGSCYLVAVEENATLLFTNQKPEGNCAPIVEAQEYFTSSKSLQDIPPPAIRQILPHSISINGSSAEEGYNNKACGKPLSSQYKGVVSQPNGRWGAQIYEKHRRVWLGTFNNEEDAARSYDTAAIKFRGHKATTNFLPGGDTRREAIFLGRHSKAEIVDMLRTHTYHEELHHSYKMNALECSNHDGANESPSEHLFEKALTPSDVGKLNRLVVPKHHAIRCLPLEPHSMQKGVVLNFADAAGKTWRFRYSYWSSSQSYVFTKGWSRYSKSNRLQSGDIVSLGRSTGSCRQLYISFRRRFSNQVLHQPAAVGTPILVRLIPDSDSPPAVPGRPTTKGLIPCPNSSSALDLHSLSPSMKSPSKKGNSCPVEYPQRKKVTTFSSTVSNVKVFGVNLSL